MKAILFLALATLLLAGCKKDDPEVQLPPATQTGANTAGCLIDGKPFVATGWGGGLLSNGVPALSGGFAFDSLFTMELNGQCQGRNTTVRLFFRSQKVGKYLLNKDTPYYPQAVARYALNHATYSISENSNEVYVTNSKNTGDVVLTYADVRSGVSAGIFEFTAASQLDPRKTVSITSGRFDCKQ